MQEDFKDPNNQSDNNENGSHKIGWDYNAGADKTSSDQSNSWAGHRPGSYTPPNDFNKPSDNYRWNFEDYQAVEQQGKTKRSKGLSVFGFLVSFVVVVALVLFAVYGVYTLVSRNNGFFDFMEQVPSPNVTQQPNTPEISINNPPEGIQSPILSDGPLSTKEIVRMVKPSVVGVENYGPDNTFVPVSEGSGIIMNEQGYIITNAHVVEGAVGINIVLNNEETYSAKLIGIDRKTDLAVVKIEADNLVAASFGNSDVLEDGDRVVAIGNPGGMKLAATTTQGIVSTAKRSFRTDSGFSTLYIQTDAAINPGNSGGPLINDYGQVVGINTAKIVAEGYEGIGFAIPINEAKPIIDQLIKFGYVKGRTKIGISGQVVNETTAQLNNIPKGIYIYSIDPSSDLAGKNVTRGDIIVKIDGTVIESFDNVSTILKSKTPNDKVTLTIYRPRQGGGGGDTFDVTIKLMADEEIPK